MVTVEFVGSGDAFGSGGRFQACISARTEGLHLLIDCGATSMVALARAGLDPASVDAIVVSHLHGDHFGGLPFFILDAQFRRGAKPLLIAGPAGVERRVTEALEVAFPGSSSVTRGFECTFLEFTAEQPTAIGEASVMAFEVPHPSGAPAFALRVAIAGRAIGYSGDCSWSESLVEAAHDTDLFIAEAYTFEKPIKHHLSYATLREHRSRLATRQLVVTHLGPEMLAGLAECEDLAAHDGLRLEL